MSKAIYWGAFLALAASVAASAQLADEKMAEAWLKPSQLPQGVHIPGFVIPLGNGDVESKAVEVLGHSLKVTLPVEQGSQVHGIVLGTDAEMRKAFPAGSPYAPQGQIAIHNDLKQSLEWSIFAL